MPEERPPCAPFPSPEGDRAGPAVKVTGHPRDLPAGGPAVRGRPPRRGRSQEDTAARQGRGRESGATSPGGSPLQVPPRALSPLRGPTSSRVPSSASPALAYPTRHLQAGTQNSNEQTGPSEIREGFARESWGDEAYQHKSPRNFQVEDARKSRTAHWSHFTDRKREVLHSRFLCYV